MMPSARSRATTWASLAGYVLLASGLPLPAGVVSPTGRDAPGEKRLSAKDRSAPFPCMDKPCGCATAEQCFADCCCHTPAERLAWARAHRIEAHVLAALERRVAAAGAPTSTDGCCAAEPGAAAARPPCCAAAAAQSDGTDDVCRDHTSRAAKPHPAPCCDQEQPARACGRARTVTLRAMLACDGLTAEWFALGTAPPPAPLFLALDGPAVGRVNQVDVAPRGGLPSPAAPPPRGV